jgi:hypothetical protein
MEIFVAMIHRTKAFTIDPMVVKRKTTHGIRRILIISHFFSPRTTWQIRSKLRRKRANSVCQIVAMHIVRHWITDE